jgi:hypothetical protein
MSSAAVRLRGGADTWVSGVVLLGVKVAARVIIDPTEHLRREATGVTAVTDPALLDRLLDLPISVPVSDPVIWTETTDQVPGIIERGEDKATVTRHLRSPLTIQDVVLHARAGRELAAVQDASLFARFARRWVATSRSPLPDAIHLEAKLCGVGVLDPNHQLLLSAETLSALTVDGWSWLLQEKVYRRWLSQQLQAHETESLPPTTGGASATRAS